MISNCGSSSKARTISIRCRSPTDSVATVRGTEWITEDTCDGTLTTVVKGAVSVRNLHNGRKKLVKAGRSYLVRSKR